MYVANQHAIVQDIALGIAKKIGVGQLITRGTELNATLLPFNVVTDGDKTVLQMHLTRVNTQWKDVGEALMVVQGPNVHVSGMDLPPERDGQKLPTVPTWNYVTVHLRGQLTFHDDEEWKRAHLAALVEQFEGEWRVGTHSSYDLVNAALVAIVGVEVAVSEIIGKAKLGQNMSPADIAYTAQHLRQRPDGGQVADLMEEIALPWAQARQERVDSARNLPIAGGLAQ